MDQSLLAKLQIKNPPLNKSNIDEIDVGFKKPLQKPVMANINTTIIDLNEEDFDRDLFLKEINDSFIENKPDLKQDLSEITEEIPAQPVKPKKIKKLKGKLKLVQQLPNENTAPTQKIIIKKSKKPKPSPIGVMRIVPESFVEINDIPVQERVENKEKSVLIKASSYYLNNREIFINFINSLFEPYKRELLENKDSVSCENRNSDKFSLMTHQKIVRDYINLYTPYRGILLYHGLGSGKTCSSIAIAEGMKETKPIIVLTPASLKRNYYEELKKCGDFLYKKNQFWEFVQSTPENIATLSSVLNLPVEFIEKNNGAWFVNKNKKSNYATLNNNQKILLDLQIDQMIRYKYQFIAYNGLRMTHLKALNAGKKNFFDNSVVVIDEAHNLVSRIVNKIGKSKAENSVSLRLYELLMSAENVKIIMLSGTPVINYPNEIGILFNILRGYIKTWKLHLNINSQRKIDLPYFKNLLKSTILGGNVTDFISYDANQTLLEITRNPFGFVNKTTKKVYDGVRLGDRGNMTDEDYIATLTKVLKKERIDILNINVDLYKSLPDTLDMFKDYFIDPNNEVVNMNLFKRRILGLTSYYRSAQESLMPTYSKSSNFHIVDVEMSDFQFGVYEEARAQERKQELNNAKKRKRNNNNNDVFAESTSTYRIFSRAFCNFVFPSPDISRPYPNTGDETDAELTEAADEDLLDAGVKLDNIDGKYEADEIAKSTSSQDYEERIKSALSMLNNKKEEYLTGENLDIYSPKFSYVLANIQNPQHEGLHLIYSQFRTLEGIGILKLVLEANGYAEFKIRNTPSGWRLSILPEDRGKPMFALYTGTEGYDEKEIIRNVYNGDWNNIPSSLRAELLVINRDNLMGQIIKVFMITASGAEGISLKNTRYVHIIEPYWHPVRVNQVIGRARRICSHEKLPPLLRTVDVFLYLMKFSEKQLTSDATIELRLKDVSKIDGKTPLTSDQALWEIANIKEEITSKLLKNIKESAIDCSIHSSSTAENLKCFSFGTVTPSTFSYQGSFENESKDDVAQLNIQTVELNAQEVTIQGIKYAYVPESGDLYDWESYLNKQPVQIGKLIKVGDKYEIQRL